MSNLEFHHHADEFDVWKFTLDILHAFPFYLERVYPSWRLRCVMEYFVGYCVYYIKKQDEWAGYCVISSGRNPRYQFSTKEDIIFGRYFIAEKFRGNGLGARMLSEILDHTGLKYRKAFAYLRYSNSASKKSIERLGAKQIKRFDIKGRTRRLYDAEDGEFVLFEYDGKKSSMKG